MKFVMKYSLSLFLLSGILITACSKDKLEIPESNDPVFTLSGTFGNETIDLVAGDNNAFMLTKTEEVNGVKRFTGTLEDGTTSVELAIFDGWIDLSSFNPAENLVSLEPPFASLPTDPLVILSKSSFENAAAMQTINWFVDGVLAGVNNAEILYPGKYEVCAEVTFWDSSTETICNEVIAGYKRNANASIDAEVNSLTQVLNAQAYAMGSNVTEVKWYYNGSYLGNAPELTYSMGNSDGELKAEITFGNGVKRTHSVYVNAQNTQKRIQDFTLFEENASNTHEQDFNLDIVVIHNGKHYESITADNTSSNVQIHNATYYGKNDEGKDVYKLDITVSAMLRSVSSFKIVPFTFDAILGIEVQ